jgi:hypothetical protein
MRNLLLILCILLISCGKPKSGKDIPDNTYYSTEADNQSCDSCFFMEFGRVTYTMSYGAIPLGTAVSLQGCSGSGTYKTVDLRAIILPQNINDETIYDMELTTSVGQCFANNHTIYIKKLNQTDLQFTFSTDNDQVISTIRKRSN